MTADVLDIIKYVKTQNEIQPSEALADVHTLLCRLLSSMLQSPLTGRMFVSSHTHTHEESEESLLRQLA